MLDFYRFASDAIVEFQEEQVEILRRLSRALGDPQLHDALPRLRPLRAAECLDFVSWDSYPLGQVERYLPEQEKVRWARTGHPDLISFNHDLYRV